MVGGKLWKPLKRGAGGKKVKNHCHRVFEKILKYEKLRSKLQ